MYATRERPSLLLDGADPVALYTGVVYPAGKPGKHPGRDASFTLMQPIA